MRAPTRGSANQSEEHRDPPDETLRWPAHNMAADRSPRWPGCRITEDYGCRSSGGAVQQGSLRMSRRAARRKRPLFVAVITRARAHAPTSRAPGFAETRRRSLEARPRRSRVLACRCRHRE